MRCKKLIIISNITTLLLIIIVADEIFTNMRCEKKTNYYCCGRDIYKYEM